jgi:hypothetical protein
MTPAALLLGTAAEGIDYPTYRELVWRVVAEGRTTGPDQSEGLVRYTALNKARMDRNERTVSLLPEAKGVLAALPPMTWLVLTEAWCGDASQSTPVMALMAAAAPNVTLRFVLRDEHPELMERYLTHGGRSIPKLIAFDPDGAEWFHWGPRPAAPQAIVREQRALPEGQRMPKAKLYEQVHAWYGRDKGVSVQRELLALLGAHIIQG